MADPILDAVLCYNRIIARGGKPLAHFLDNYPNAPERAVFEALHDALPVVRTLPPDDAGEFRRALRDMGARIVDQGRGIVEISLRSE